LLITLVLVGPAPVSSNLLALAALHLGVPSRGKPGDEAQATR